MKVVTQLSRHHQGTNHNEVWVTPESSQTNSALYLLAKNVSNRARWRLLGAMNACGSENFTEYSF
jgi:hypothetical protein